jgi:DNA-binding NtrC family response regulator
LTGPKNGKGNISVFVVDDNPLIASTLTRILKINGFDAEFFVNAQDALNIAEQSQPDLLISEVMMPELSGIKLANDLKALCPDCKVLLFSAHPDKARSQLEAIGTHNFEFLTKPVHPEALVAYINRMMS